MEITNVDNFLRYYEKVKKRTQRLFHCIPEDKIEWTYQEGKFTMGDVIRHLANLERYMFAENVQFKESKYAGCGIEYANGLENVLKYYNKKYQESIHIFSQLSDTDLLKKCQTPGGIEISVWKWLRAMVEHEIHHRGQLYLYLAMMGIKTPPMYGLTSEEVIQNSVN
ncbi:DinB family protein [Fulvivirga sp. M361]|uniref:DinB family protein n=1 Tax=Fulvivirga sp. M361 TaxID=2594266 RepID=UPI00117BDD7D|nr:DinB family protein [Fulvivirga sp. M361]TRX59365.1 DinB family protein [Fulvivirga sp. M361]